MDPNEKKFAERVAAVVADLPWMRVGRPVFFQKGQSSASQEYSGAFCTASSEPMDTSGQPSLATYANCAASAPTGMPTVAGRTLAESQYWMGCRSLRLWPIEDDNLRDGLRDFLKGKLKLDSAFLADVGSVSMKKVAAGPRSKVKGEVIAVLLDSSGPRHHQGGSKRTIRAPRGGNPFGGVSLPSAQFESLGSRVLPSEKEILTDKTRY